MVGKILRSAEIQKTNHMTKPRMFAVIASSIVIIFSVAIFGVSRIKVESPTIQRVLEITSHEHILDLSPEFHPPYALLIGVPGSEEAPPHFLGSIEVTIDDGSTRTIQISSETSQRSNWLHDPNMTGYILTWNNEVRLLDPFERGGTYRIRFSFRDSPPAGCTIWFSSMRHLSLL